MKLTVLFLDACVQYFVDFLSSHAVNGLDNNVASSSIQQLVFPGVSSSPYSVRQPDSQIVTSVPLETKTTAPLKPASTYGS